MFIITGFDRTGTSLIAAIFHELGYSQGQWDEKIRGGYEGTPVTEMNKLLLGGAYNETMNEIMRSMGDEIAICKDPRFMDTLGIWLKAGANIEGIIYCSREHRDAIERKSRCQFEMADIKLRVKHRKLHEDIFFDIATKAGIPILPLRYPLWLQWPKVQLDQIREFVKPIKTTKADYAAAWARAYIPKEVKV